MDRVLALQGLTSFDADPEQIVIVGASSNSGTCSAQSSGQGASSCSVGCGGASEMEW